jgi:hypothetical protein
LHEEEEEEEEEDLFSALRERIFRLIINELQATRSTMHDSFKPNFMLTPPGRVVFMPCLRLLIFLQTHSFWALV